MQSFTKDNVIPLNKHGYIIAKNFIYTLPYKYTHDFFTACIFKDKIEESGISLNDITIDNAPTIMKDVIYTLPVIHVSTFNVPEKTTLVYNIFISKPDKQLFDLLIHLLVNVYGVDGSEEVDVNITTKLPFKNVNSLITYLRQIK